MKIFYFHILLFLSSLPVFGIPIDIGNLINSIFSRKDNDSITSQNEVNSTISTLPVVPQNEINSTISTLSVTPQNEINSTISTLSVTPQNEINSTISTLPVTPQNEINSTISTLPVVPQNEINSTISTLPVVPQNEESSTDPKSPNNEINTLDPEVLQNLVNPVIPVENLNQIISEKSNNNNNQINPENDMGQFDPEFEMAKNVLNSIDDTKFNTGIYLSSIGNYLTDKDVERNIEYVEKHRLDIYGKKMDVLKPVVIYLFGGTWHMGEKALYSKLGDFLKDNGFIGVIPNYVQFPFGTVDEMIYDISKAINWVYDNIGEYGGDRDNITIFGHSSGAHLAALDLIKTTLKIENEEFPLVKLPLIKRAVLLNGVYDFDAFSNDVKENKDPDIHPQNTFFEKFVTAVLGTENGSPTDILKQYPAGKGIKSLGVSRIIVVKSDQDVTVPPESIDEFTEQLKTKTNVDVVPYLVEGYYHCGITEGIMTGDKKAEKIVIDLLTTV